MIEVMDMIYKTKDDVPDFGSIKMTNVDSRPQYKNNITYRIREYILKSSDVSKLDSITNAADGSTAFCVDTADLYILHIGEWVKFGG